MSEYVDEKDELIKLAAEENELWKTKVKEIQEKESVVLNEDVEHAETIRILEGSNLMQKLSLGKVNS